MNFRLAVISGAFPPFKAPESAHTLFLCERLAQRGVDVHLLTTRRDRSVTEQLATGVTVYAEMADWGWRRLAKLANFLKVTKPEAILLIYIDWIYGCNPLITFTPTIARRLRCGSKFVTLFENENELSGMSQPSGLCNRLATRVAMRLAGTRGLHPTYGALLRDSSHIIALSERHLEAFERAEPGVRGRAAVIPAPPLIRMQRESVVGSARHEGRQMLGLSEREVVLVYFGYVYPLKGLETLISAFGQLPTRTRLLIVGGFSQGPYLDGLRELSRRAGGAERVRWLGYLEDGVASLCLHAADLCVLPFNAGVRLNNSSFAVAAAHGLPIVATRGATLEAPFIDGQNVRLCPPKDPDALAAAMIDLIIHPETAARLRSGARRLAEECFSAERTIDAMLRILAGC